MTIDRDKETLMESRACRFFLTFCLVFQLLLLIPGPALAETDTVIIGLIPEMNVFKQQERFLPLARYLSEKTDVDFKLTMLSRYGNIIERFKSEKIDAAFLGSFTGALTILQLQAEPLARPVNMDGTSTYFGNIFVRSDSGINSAADMKGKVLALVERATTAGYIFPRAWLKQQGVNDLGSHFKELFFAGSHDATIYAVLNGEADVGAGKNTIFDRVRQEDPRVDNEIKILASSPRFPSNGLCVRAGLDDKLKKQIKKVLLEMHSSNEGRLVLEKFGAQRFVETRKEDYQPVIDMAAEAGIELMDYQYFNP